MTDDATETEPFRLVAHRFSMEAFALAKAFVAGEDPAPLQAKAAELQAQLPELAARLPSAPEAERADINRVLADARLDLAYVTGGGNRPSSIRLAPLINDG